MRLTRDLNKSWCKIADSEIVLGSMKISLSDETILDPDKLSFLSDLSANTV